MKGRTLLIIVLAIILSGVLIFAAMLKVLGDNAATDKQANGPKEVKTTIVPGSSKFQTNLKGTKSIIVVSFHIEVAEDKRLMAVMKEREPEARSKVLEILRDKTIEDANGTQGKVKLEKEILKCYKSLYGDSNIINIYIDDLVVQ